MTGRVAGVARRAAGMAVALVAFFAVSVAQAQNVRFIRTNGNDANACTLTQPCRTLQRGIQAAPVRGEVRLLDSGAFGAGVTIVKSITISGNGNTLILSGDDAITINNAAVKVVLRDLLLSGLGTGADGVVVTAAASMHIVGCEVERFTENGIEVQAGAVETFVSDTILRNNGADGLVVSGNGTTRLSLENFRAENNGGAGALIADAQSSVTRSAFSGNGIEGIRFFNGAAGVAWSTSSNNAASGFDASNADVQLESSLARGNGVAGVFVAGVASLSDMTVTDNSTGLSNSGTVRTRGNNRIFGNGTDFVGPGTTTPLGGI
jgi:hypothetical protein